MRAPATSALPVSNECNVAFESHVARPVDHAQAAAPEDRGDQVLLQLPADQRVSGQLLYCISFCSA